MSYSVNKQGKASPDFQAEVAKAFQEIDFLAERESAVKDAVAILVDEIIANTTEGQELTISAAGHQNDDGAGLKQIISVSVQ